MDVFEGEDGIYHVDLTDDIVRNRDMAYLRQFPNVVLTQHMAFYTQLSMDSMIEKALALLLAEDNTENPTNLALFPCTLKTRETA